MPAKKLPPDQRLDFQITFTLQHNIGDAFQALCKHEAVTLQEMLRTLVMEELLKHPPKESLRQEEASVQGNTVLSPS